MTFSNKTKIWKVEILAKIDNSYVITKFNKKRYMDYLYIKKKLKIQ